MRAAPEVPAASLLAFGAGVLAGRRWPAGRIPCAPAPALDPERLADDLHDVVTHRLTTMVVQADAALTGPAGRSPQTAAALAAIAASGREALAELRDLLRRLHPDPAPTRPPRGLADLPLLLELAGGPSRRVTLKVQGEPPAEPPAELRLLTGRELEVLALLGHGLSNPEIAAELGDGEDARVPGADEARPARPRAGRRLHAPVRPHRRPGGRPGARSPAAPLSPGPPLSRRPGAGGDGIGSGASVRPTPRRLGEQRLVHSEGGGPGLGQPLVSAGSGVGSLELGHEPARPS